MVKIISPLFFCVRDDALNDDFYVDGRLVLRAQGAKKNLAQAATELQECDASVSGPSPETVMDTMYNARDWLREKFASLYNK